MLWATLFAAEDDLLGTVKHELRESVIKIGFAVALCVGGLLFFGLFTLLARLFRKQPNGTAVPAPPSPAAPDPELFDAMYDAARAAAAGHPGGTPDHARMHRRILLFGLSLGGGGLAVGLLFLRSVIREDRPNTSWGAVIAIVAMVTFIGYFVGVALGCLFAPSDFYAGPVGQRWLRLVGTQSVTAARVVCLALIALVIGLAVAGLALTGHLR
jgi:hypothetical protein